MFARPFAIIACLLIAAPCQSKEPVDKPLNIVSFNVRYDNPNDGPNRWSQRSEAVANILQRADVAGLQEVLHHQLVDLQKALEDFSVVGVGRDDGKRGGEYSPILYRTSQFSVTDSGTFWLSPTPTKVGSKGWDAALPRICTWAKLRQRESGRELYVLNTHFDHRGSEARVASGKLIAKHIAETRGELPVVLTGDFNALPGSEPIKAILAGGLPQKLALADSRLISSSKPVGPASTWNGFANVAPERRIDFIFVGGPLDVVSYKELTTQLPDGRFPSDHLPVQIEIELK